MTLRQEHSHSPLDHVASDVIDKPLRVRIEHDKLSVSAHLKDVFDWRNAASVRDGMDSGVSWSPHRPFKLMPARAIEFNSPLVISLPLSDSEEPMNG